jgi:hypothetical protein
VFQTVDLLIPAAWRRNIRPLVVEGRGEVNALAKNQPNGVVVAKTNVLATYVGYILCYGVTVRTQPGQPEYDWSGSIGFNLAVAQGPVIDNISAAGGNGFWTLQRGSVLQPIPTLIRVDGNQGIQFIAKRLVDAAQAQTVDFFASGIQIPEQGDCELHTMFPDAFGRAVGKAIAPTTIRAPR